MSRFAPPPSLPTTAKSGFDSDSDIETDGTLKPMPKPKRRRGRCAACCCWSTMATAAAIVLGLVALLTIELTSRPGYARSSQDTHSQDTMVKLQSAREAMPALVAKLNTTSFNLSAPLGKNERAVSRAVLVGHLQRATAFSSAAYTAQPNQTDSCPRPVGSTMMRSFADNGAGVGGFVARDDVAQQVVVAVRGVGGLRDVVLHFDVAFDRLDLIGAAAGQGVVPNDVLVQRGYQRGAQAVQREVVDSVTAELRGSRKYSVLVTGHGLGGSVAVLLALSLRETLPAGTPVLVVTQGQPRTGNQVFANHVDRVFPPTSGRLFRVVHHLDAIPTLRSGNFLTNPASRHHAGEVWQVDDTAVPAGLIFCRGQEDRNCSSSRPGEVVQGSPPAIALTAEHWHYLDIELGSTRSRQCGMRGGQILPALFTSRGELKSRPRQEPGIIGF